MHDGTMNLDAIFRETAKRQPEHAALLGRGAGGDLTYAELDSAIEKAARALALAGIESGDCVGLHWTSGKEYIVQTYALWRLGACVVPIPVELVDEEKRQILREIRIDAVLTNPEGAMFAVPLKEGVAFKLADGAGEESGPILLRIAQTREHPPGFTTINPAFIRFTSGTTGTSKGVVLSHETIFARIQAANEVLKIGPEDSVLWLLSMSYHFAVSIAGYLTLGATIVLPKNHLAEEMLLAAETCHVTIIYGSPTHYAWMASAPELHDLRALRLAISTTAPLEEETGREFFKRFGVPVAQALGLIEIGLPCINTGFAVDRSASVGRPLPAYLLRLDDVGFGDHCKEIYFSGPGSLDAYYDPWQTRDEIMPDGWFRTGDVGEIDEDGCLFLRGRAKDVINVMGMKFFPHEVESVLATHPMVAESCVMAEVDPRLGEMPFAKVVLKPGGVADFTVLANDLIDLCRSRVASYKVPFRIEFVESLVKTPSGKILHRPQPRRQGARPPGGELWTV